jgi:hypothetical protein
MAVVKLELPVPVSEIWALFSDFQWGSYALPTWAECLSEASRTNRGDVVGEVHLKGDAQPDDFERVPTGRPLQVVMLPQGEGFSLRWLDQGEKEEDLEPLYEILGGFTHDALVRLDDAWTPVGKFPGAMTVRHDGHLEFFEY